MKIKYFILLIIFLFGNVYLHKVFSQEENLKDVEFEIIAEGTDSPIPNLQIVCFNKYFNKDYLPSDFRKKYNLDVKKLYKRKMLIQVFHSDKNKKGLDKIELIGIKESDKKLVVTYNIINSNTENDDKIVSPFLILQITKSKKEIKFIVNGTKLGEGTEIYLD
ncbi:MAG: hypothetical protein ACJARX_000602 [Psychroserpens sp.]|uniref:hypothetical protein n=1 Tax=Psychroserpens sp. TaxID=2020870 RepID=UPI0039E2864F